MPYPNPKPKYSGPANIAGSWGAQGWEPNPNYNGPQGTATYGGQTGPVWGYSGSTPPSASSTFTPSSYTGSGGYGRGGYGGYGGGGGGGPSPEQIRIANERAGIENQLLNLETGSTWRNVALQDKFLNMLRKEKLLKGRLKKLDRLGVKDTAEDQLRSLMGDATARGAYTAQGTRTEAGEIDEQKARELRKIRQQWLLTKQGIRAEKLGTKESRAKAVDRLKAIELERQQVELARQAATT